VSGRSAIVGSTAGLAAPVTTTAVCSGPDASQLDVHGLVTTDGNRWSAPGEPTLYLAGDAGVALAEVGRHWQPGPDPDPDELGLWEVDLVLRAAVDLRPSETRAAAGIPDDPSWFLDRGRCRDLAQRLREAGCDGLVVPSVAFLDQLDRWNAVVFADRVPSLPGAVRHPRRVQRILPEG
jgi:RES domain-containing protein